MRSFDRRSQIHRLRAQLATRRRKAAQSPLTDATHILCQVSDAVVVTDVDLRIRQWNRAAEELYGWPAVEVIGRTAMEFLTVRYPDANSREQVLHTLATRGFWRGDAIITRRDGQERVIEVIAQNLYAADASVVGSVTVSRDITARKAAEVERGLLIAREQAAIQTLRDSEERFRTIIENSQDATVLTDLQTRIHYASAAIQPILGYTPEELIGTPMIDLIDPSDLMTARQANQHLQQPGSVGELQVRARHRDGSWRWIRVRRSNQLENPAIGFIVSSFHDVTEQLRAEDDLKQYMERLRTLSRRLVEAQEQERRHIARELHDEIGQVLTGLKLSLEMALQHASGPLAYAIAPLRSDIALLIDRVRTLSLDLRPLMLDDLGLIPALQWHIARYTAQTQVRVSLRHNGIERRFPPEIEITAYRVIQEALTNVARHAQAPEVAVRLLADHSCLVLRVDDDGVGFAVDAVLAAGATGGLSGMLERVHLLGGELTIESDLGAGTHLIAELPLAAPPAYGEGGRP